MKTTKNHTIAILLQKPNYCSVNLQKKHIRSFLGNDATIIWRIFGRDLENAYMDRYNLGTFQEAPFSVEYDGWMIPNTMVIGQDELNNADQIVVHSLHAFGETEESAWKNYSDISSSRKPIIIVTSPEFSLPASRDTDSFLLLLDSYKYELWLADNDPNAFASYYDSDQSVTDPREKAFRYSYRYQGEHFYKYDKPGRPKGSRRANFEYTAKRWLLVLQYHEKFGGDYSNYEKIARIITENHWELFRSRPKNNELTDEELQDPRNRDSVTGQTIRVDVKELERMLEELGTIENVKIRIDDLLEEYRKHRMEVKSIKKVGDSAYLRHRRKMMCDKKSGAENLN